MKTVRFLRVIVIFALCLVVQMLSAPLADAKDDTGKSIGSTVQLFVDDWLIDKMSNVRFTLHRPERRELVFAFDKPYDSKQTGYVTVLRDDSKFRMYYRSGGDLSRDYTCLAESSDGISWTSPDLGLYEFNGSKHNNIVFEGAEPCYFESHNFAPFVDQNPQALPEQRYKAVGMGRYPDEKSKGRRIALVALASPDGIHWKRMQEKAVITEGAFDSLNTVLWDVVQKQYVCYLRIRREGKRSIARCTSPDFLQWSKPEPLDFGATPLEHLYTNGIVQYFRAPQFYLGFPMRFVPERTTIGADSRTIDGLSDGVFMSSRDGLHWDRRFMEAFIRPGLNLHNWGEAHNNNTPAWGILQTSEHELSLYWMEDCDTVPRLRRGTLRLDGFVSLNAPYAGGEFMTRPFTFEGKNLILNYATSAVGSVKVEILDKKRKRIPGFEAGACKEIYGDEISRTVSWGDKSDVSALAGKPIRLRFLMKDADLFSFKFE